MNGEQDNLDLVEKDEGGKYKKDDMDDYGGDVNTDDNKNVNHPYLRGVLSLTHTVQSHWPFYSTSSTNSEVHVIFCVVWLLTWCILGALLVKLFARIKLWRRGCR